GSGPARAPSPARPPVGTGPTPPAPAIAPVAPAAPGASTSGPVPTPVPAAGSPPVRGASRSAGLFDRLTTPTPSPAPAIAPYQVAGVPAGRRATTDLYDAARADEVVKVIDAVLAV